jgi:hypothetical protein
MIGHQQILTLRAAGKKPGAVFVTDRIAPRNAGRDLENGCYPTVYVGGDNPATTDMRFVIGCEVHLHADDESRAVDWLDTLLQAHPKVIVQLTGKEVHTWRP